MTWTPRIVARTVAPCWPWAERFNDPADQQPLARLCIRCKIDVALPRADEGHTPMCLYCAMDRGLIPAEIIEPGDDRSLRQIAQDHHEARR